MTKLIMMDVPGWIAVPGNPRQRNTEERLRRSKHFDVIEKPHLELRAGELPDGSLVKLDGHTRAAKWLSNLAEAPQGKVLFVIVHEIPDLDEAMRLYDMYDSREAVEDSRDKVFGAFRQMGWTPESKFMRDARLTTALKLALNCACVEKYLSGDTYNLSASGKPVIRSMDVSTYIPQPSPVKLGPGLRKTTGVRLEA